MGFWENFGNNVAETSRTGQLLRKNRQEDEEKKQNSRKLSDAIGNPETETSFRNEVVNVPVGPLNKPQQGALDATQLQNANIHPMFKNMTFGEAKQIAPLVTASNKQSPEDAKAEWDRRFDKQTERLAQNQNPQKTPGLDILIRETGDNLPKLKAAAIGQQSNIKSIDRALDLVEKGVTGAPGQLKAMLAPYAEFVGQVPENLSDAQSFQLLTRLIVGPMRLDIVGPGPVSEWEQKLMQQMSGGGGAGQAAAREILSKYREMAGNKINDYNTTVQGAYTLSPLFKNLYQPMEVMPRQTQSQVNPQDQEALTWAKANANDPRAIQIMKKLGGR